MQRLREDPHRAVILGGGRGGHAMLEMLVAEPMVEVAAVADVDPDAPAMQLARELGIPTFSNVEQALRASAPCVAFNLTGNEMVEAVASEILGAGGVIGGLEARLIWKMVTNLREAKEELRHLANHDALTGLFNRRHMLDQLRRELAGAVRYGHPCSLAMIDIDHFKKINDTHGHAAGDEVLRTVARVLRGRMRESDIIGRWGGEEFLAVLPHAVATQAAGAVQGWLDELMRHEVRAPDGARIRVSFSAGTADWQPGDDAGDGIESLLERLLHEADTQLYYAKDSGRACCMHGCALPAGEG